MAAFGALALVAWDLPNLGARRPYLSGRLRRFFQQAIGGSSVVPSTYRAPATDRRLSCGTGDLSRMPSIGKIALFIDGSNLHATAKALGFDIDYRRLLGEFQSRGTLLRAFYYTTVVEDQEYSSTGSTTMDTRSSPSSPRSSSTARPAAANCAAA